MNHTLLASTIAFVLIIIVLLMGYLYMRKFNAEPSAVHKEEVTTPADTFVEKPLKDFVAVDEEEDEEEEEEEYYDEHNEEDAYYEEEAMEPSRYDEYEYDMNPYRGDSPIAFQFPRKQTGDEY